MISEIVLNIAVVEDHDMVREELSHMLSLIGFKVIIRAANGKDFLAQMMNAKDVPDLCLLDIDMPFMDGVQTTDCIKTIWPEIKIIAHTFGSNLTEAIMNSGADACITKGCGIIEIKERLMELYIGKLPQVVA